MRLDLPLVAQRRQHRQLRQSEPQLQEQERLRFRPRRLPQSRPRRARLGEQANLLLAPQRLAQRRLGAAL